MQLQQGALGFQFDATMWNPTQGTGKLPEGNLPVIILRGEVKATKDNQSGYLELTLQVIDGPHKGVTGPYRLNIHNKNDKAREIASQKLSAIVHAVGGPFKFDNVSAIANKPFRVHVIPQKDDPNYTEVDRIFDINGNVPQAGQAPPPQAAQAQPQTPVPTAPFGGTVISQPQPTQTAPVAPPPATSWPQPTQASPTPAPQPQAQTQAPVATQWGQAPTAGQPAPWG